MKAKVLSSIGILLLALQLAAPIAQATCVTDAFNSRVASRIRAAALSDVSAVIHSEFTDFPEKSRWLQDPVNEPITEQLVDKLILLSPGERKKVLKQLEAHPPRDPGLLRTLRLALYDESAWQAYVDDFTRHAPLDNALVDALIPVMRKMPEDLKARLYSRITPAYAELSKHSFRLLPLNLWLRLAPKRATDAFIAHTFRGDELVRGLIESGKTPLAAYGSYLKALRTRIFHGTRFGNYNVSDVMNVCRAIQGVLREKGAEFGGPDLSFTITGSLPNGRADLAASDIDTQLSNWGAEKLYGEIDEKVNAALRAKFPDAHLETHSMYHTTTPHFVAQINPMFLRITSSRIELLVYPPFRGLRRDRVLRPFNYPEPAVYTLEEKAPLIAERPGAEKGSAAAEMSEPLAEVQAAIAKNYAELPATPSWLNEPSDNPKVEALVEKLLALSPKERDQARGWVKAHPPESPELKTVLGLGLYDPDTWNQYFDQFSTRPEPDTRLSNALEPLLEKMPEPLKDSLYHRIHSIYPSVSRIKYIRKLRWFRKEYLEFAPKRAVDVFIASTFPPDRAIHEGIQAGKAPLDSYSDYLGVLRKRIFSGLKAGDYGTPEVMAVLHAIQSILRERGGTDSTITLSGSMPNGRAILETSDLDVVPSDFRLEKLYDEMNTRVNTALAGMGHPEAKLKLHSMFRSTTEVDASIVNPILFKVGLNRIEMEVYPRFRTLKGDKYHLPKNYPGPDRYVVEGAR